MLELKSLLIGLVFAVGIFAVKTGAGLAYFIARRKSVWTTIAVSTSAAAVYLGLFLLSLRICGRLDMVYYFNRLRILFQSGMALHFLTAAGLLIWGWALLRRRPETEKHGSLGWLALVIPCPVCASVIVFTTGFLVSFFPDDSLKAVLQAYALFVVIMLGTVATLVFATKKFLLLPERALAYGMICISAYFVLSVLLVPQFGDVDKVYRIAAYQSSQSSVDFRELVGLFALAATAILIGFVLQRLRWRSVQ